MVRVEGFMDIQQLHHGRGQRERDRSPAEHGPEDGSEVPKASATQVRTEAEVLED
jgi:hypothetical protein